MNPDPQNLQTWAQNRQNAASTIGCARCMCVFVFFGTGFLLMGTLFTAISPNFQRPEGSNTPRTLGIVFLCVGGIMLVFGTVSIISAKQKLNDMERQYQQSRGVTGVSPPGPVVAGMQFNQTPFHSAQHTGLNHQHPSFAPSYGPVGGNTYPKSELYPQGTNNPPENVTSTPYPGQEVIHIPQFSDVPPPYSPTK